MYESIFKTVSYLADKVGMITMKLIAKAKLTFINFFICSDGVWINIRA